MNYLLVDVPGPQCTGNEYSLIDLSYKFHGQNIALDTETTGLMPYHGDKVFAIVFSDKENSYYWPVPKDGKLHPEIEKAFNSQDVSWSGHNIKFDMHAIWCTFGVNLAGPVLDTMIAARLVDNERMSYSLDACASMDLGVNKSDAVEEYIIKNDLWEWQEIPGKKTRKKKKFFEKVPFDIMFEYACKDGRLAYDLSEYYLKKIFSIDSLLPDAPKLESVYVQECKLLKVVFEMEKAGLKADPEFSQTALEFYNEEQKTASEEFKNLTGQEYKSSPKMFAEIFAGEKEKWSYTEKGNPSFDSDTIKRFDHPAAKQIIILRNAKSRTDFFASFDFFSDSKNFIHPSFNQAGTASGRFSSSDPNFQNLTNDEGAEEGTLPVRNAIVPPSEEFCIVSFDYDQQEYRMMLDYAGEMELIEQIKAGVDVHQATADMMGVSRKYAKTLNFMLLYGGGVLKLAEALNIPEWEAKNLRELYFSKLPRVQQFINTVIKTAKMRGYVYNWLGRRYWCQHEFAYKMPNRIIQGGGADVMKKAMVEIHARHNQARSYMFMTVHDELDFYIHKSELYLVGEIKKIMESTYPHKNLPLTVSVSHSWKSLGELEDGAPITPKEAETGSGMAAIPGMAGVPIPSGKGKGSTDWGTWLGGHARTEEEFMELKKLLKCFGIHPNEAIRYNDFKVRGECLLGLTRMSQSTLARVESQILSYQAKTYGVDLRKYS